jgi:hypothetical protein
LSLSTQRQRCALRTVSLAKIFICNHRFAEIVQLLAWRHSQKKKESLVRQRLRVGNLIELLKAGQEVSLRDFKNAIDKDDFEEYEQLLEQRRSEIDWMTSLDGSSDYDSWLKKGLLAYGKGENCRGKKSSKYHREAQRCFEQAIECLQSDCSSNPSVIAAYDRDISNDDYSLDPVGMPRRRTSKSLDNMASIDKTLNKSKLKLQILESVYARLVEKEGKDQKVDGRKEKEVRGRRRKKDGLELLTERLSGKDQQERAATKSKGSTRSKGKKVVEGNKRKEGDGKVATDNQKKLGNIGSQKLRELMAQLKKG